MTPSLPTSRRVLGAAALMALASVGTVTLAGCGVDAASNASGATRSAAVATTPESTTPEPTTPTALGSATLQTTRRFFAASSAWNQRVDSDPVAPNSASLLQHAAERVGVIERSADSRPLLQRTVVHTGLTVNTDRWTTPIVDGGVPTKIACRQADCGDGITSLPIPAGLNPDPRYDGWLTVIDGDTAYDLWRARRESDGSISYQFMRTWDLNGPGAGSPGQDSARGSGLPLFAGVIRQTELDAGLINHALAIAVPAPAQRLYVRPASATNGNGTLSSLPEGARIRLKDGVRLVNTTIDGQPLSRREQRSRDAILVALHQYGAIVVDRAAVPTLFAERGISPEALSSNELAKLGLASFDVVSYGSTLSDPPATTEATTP